jgi:hypothetical protein
MSYQAGVGKSVFITKWRDSEVAMTSDALPMLAPDLEKQMHDMAQEDEPVGS